MSSGTSQQFCVRWNSHLGSLGAAFPQLLAGQRFVDVTLACEGHQLHCHRLVLAACSTYFESLLGENPCKHPIIILPRDIKLWEIQALVDFMYKGEVNVSQAGLSDLLKCAEILQIRGLCGSDAALNLNQVNSNIAQQSTPSSPSSSSSSSSSSSCLSAAAAAASATNASASSSHLSTSVTSSTTTQLTADLLTSQQSSNANNERLGDDVQTAPINSCVDVMKTRKSSSSNESNNIRRTTTTSTYGRNDDSSSSSSSLLLTNVKREATDANGSQNLENRIIDKLEPTDGLMDIEVDHPDLSQSTDKTSDESFSTKYVEYLESGKGEGQHHLTQTQQQLHHERDTRLSVQLTKLPTLQSRPSTSSSSSNQETNILANYSNNSISSICVKNTTNNCVKSVGISSSSCYDEVGDIYAIRDVVAIEEEDEEDQQQQQLQQKQLSRHGHIHPDHQHHFIENASDVRHLTRPNYRNSSRGQIRVKSNENLFDNYSNSNGKNKTKLLLGNSDRGPVKETINRIDKIKYGHRSPPLSASTSRFSRRSLPGALRFNRNSMTVFLKPAKDDVNRSVDEFRTPQSKINETSGGDGEEGTFYCTNKIKKECDSTEETYENIVCLPNVMEMYNENEEEDNDMIADNAHTIDGARRHHFDIAVNAFDNVDYEDIKISDEVIYAQRIHSPTRLLSYGDSGDMHSSDHEVSRHYSELEVYEANGRDGVDGRPMEFAMKQFLSSSHHNNDNKIIGGQQRPQPLTANNGSRRCRYINSRTNTIADIRSPHHDTEPSLSAVVLRNPRSNQPRAYNNDALYAALMDVKAGESIYRASQIHKVPRKTLRNWMKRWHIKSAYPMPRQLKQAAEKKKRIQQQLEEKTLVAKPNSSCSISNNTTTPSSSRLNVAFNNLNCRIAVDAINANQTASATASMQSSHKQNNNCITKKSN